MPDTIPLESYYDLRLLTELAVSPDGDRVAFIADEFDAQEDERRSGLYTVPTDGSESPHRLTHASTASSPRWSPAGERLAFLASRNTDLAQKRARREDEEDDEGQGPKTQVWLLDLARGGDARQLTNFDEGVSEFDWSPDGEQLVVSARDPTEEQEEYLERRREEDGPIEVTRLQHKRDGPGWLDDVTTYLFVGELPGSEEALDAESADRLDDAYGAGGMSPLAGVQPRWGPGGRIAFVTCLDDNPDDQPYTDLFTIKPDGSDRRQVTDGDLTVGSPRWSPAGDRLAFIGRHATNWYRPAEVFLADDPAPSDAGQYRSLSNSLDRTLAWEGTPEWVAEDTLVSAFADEGWARLVQLDAEADDPTRVWEGQGTDRTVRLFDLAGGTVAVALTAPSQPSDVFTLNATDLLESGDEVGTVQVTEINDSFTAEHHTPTHRRITYENSDGDDVEAIVYLPPDFDPDSDDPAPTVTAIHGGPMSYDAPEFDFTLAYWCSRGYIVIKPNYRGSTSYGRAWAETLKGTRGDLESDDIVSGVRHLVDVGWSDSERLFCTGFSYGGIATGHIVTQYHDFAAAAPEHGIYDNYSNFGTDDNHTWHEWEFGLPWENVETYRDVSSLTDVGEIETPLLITAGEEDWRCPPTQAEQLYVSVRKQGIDAKLVIYPDEHHNVGPPKRATHRLDELTSWFETHDPAFTPDPTEESH